MPQIFECLKIAKHNAELLAAPESDSDGYDDDFED